MTADAKEGLGLGKFIGSSKFMAWCAIVGLAIGVWIVMTAPYFD